jgi:hypothetical protein
MTPEYLRALALSCNAAADRAAREHEVLAAKLAGVALSPAARAAVSDAALIHDCMARRNRQWARAAMAAAIELEEA